MANKRKPEEWRELINKQQQSGLTISTFCRENNVSTSCFYAYRAQLTQAAKPEFIQAVTAPEPQTSTAPTTLTITLVTQAGDLIFPAQIPPNIIVDVIKGLHS